MNLLRNLFRARTPAEREMDPHLAAAALLVEAALVDGVYVNIESDMIAEILLEAFNLEADKVDELIQEGETLAEEAVDSYNFTRHVKKLPMESRVSVVEGLYRVALRYTRERTQAEDLVHDTVARALRFREHFEPGTNFKAWIYTILTHTFIHKYRRQTREREVLEGASREDVERMIRDRAWALSA